MVHVDDADMWICTSLCACKNLDTHLLHTKEKMSHFEETLNKIEDGRWLPLLGLLFICPSHINHSGASNLQVLLLINLQGVTGSSRGD